MKQPPLPKQVKVRDAIYTVIFMDRLSGGDLGGMDPVNRLIMLSLDQTPEELVASWFHEFCHAIEHEYGVKMGHKVINRLEYDLVEIARSAPYGVKRGRAGML